MLTWEEQQQPQLGSSADTNANATRGGALEVHLFDADPAAFASLLAYLYSDTLQVSGSAGHTYTPMICYYIYTHTAVRKISHSYR